MTSEIEEIIDFGDYVQIEQKRYGIPNEIYCYKVIGANSKSNAWVNVPVQTPAEEVLHDTMEDVVRCVCCGVDEREILKFRVKDVVKTPNSTIHQKQEQEFRNFWNFITGRVPFENNYDQKVTITFRDIEKFLQFKKGVQDEK